MKKLLVSLACLVMMSGCAVGYQKVDAARPEVVAKGALSVQPLAHWNRIRPQMRKETAMVGLRMGLDKTQRSAAWTANGLELDTIVVASGLTDGTPLIAALNDKEKRQKTYPVYRAGMMPQELVELFETSYRTASGNPTFAVRDLAPYQGAAGQGVRFGFDYVSKDEIKRRGSAVLATGAKGLSLMVFEAAALHYYAAGEADFQAVVAGAKGG